MDDRGTYVVPPFFSTDKNLESNDKSRMHVLNFDSVLSDGYYNAVAKSFYANSKSVVGIFDSNVFFVSVGGKLSEVSRKEWNENSLINVAFKGVEGVRSEEEY